MRQVAIQNHLCDMGNILKEGKWVPYELRETKRSEKPLVKFWFGGRKESSSSPTSKRNIHGKKERSMSCCRQGETVTTNHYQQQLMNLYHVVKVKRPEWTTRYGKVILLNDKVPPHVAKSVKNTFKVHVFFHPPDPPDITPSFELMVQSLSVSY